MRFVCLGLCAVLLGCSGASAGEIPDSVGSTTQDSSETEPTPGATSNTETPAPMPVDAGALPPSMNDSGAPVPDASSDAGPVVCAMSLPTAVAFAQCAAKPAATLVGQELVEPSSATRSIAKDTPVCGRLKKGGRDTFTLAVKKGDCLAFDFHAKTAALRVAGVAGANVSSAGGDDHALAQTTAAGTLTITVTTTADDNYTLTVR
jgi:hypothetical protein